jgi:hypothetical protein
MECGNEVMYFNYPSGPSSATCASNSMVVYFLAPTSGTQTLTITSYWYATVTETYGVYGGTASLFAITNVLVVYKMVTYTIQGGGASSVYGIPGIVFTTDGIQQTLNPSS